MPTEIATVPHVLLHYNDTLSPHTMMLTTRPPVTPVPGTNPQYESWSSTPIDASAMVEEMVDGMLSNMLPMTTFTHFDVFDAPDPEQPPRWLYTEFLTSKVGTLVNTGAYRALSYTMSFRCADGGLAKIVMLNTAVGNTWGNVVGLSARDADIATAFLLPGNAWSGRSGGQPLAFTNITISLNKRLRRKYDMI